MIIPAKFQKILENDKSLLSLVLSIETSFEPIYKDNKLFFFEEYTEHGIDHIEKVIKASEFLIPDESFQYIQPKEVAILFLSVVLHDIGMHTEFSTFKALIDGKYDDVRIKALDSKTWRELWLDYLSEARHFSSKLLDDIFGNPNEIVNEPDLSDKDKLTGIDKKLIGEFIRRHHARLAHEIALKGFIVNTTIPFGNSDLDERDRQLIGIVARSHGINIRDTFVYLKEIAQDAWQLPDGLNIVFIMVLLRVADYLQIDKTRTDSIFLKTKTFNSPLSLREHQTHLSIRHIHFGKIKEPELIYVECNKPDNARMYIKIQTLIEDIQHEMDLSWAILGEIYGFMPKEKPKIIFRRIDSNLKGLELDYVPQKISFQVNNELSKLLITPLYGNNPTYGVRELVQNATDACKERMKIEQEKGNLDYTPLVTVSIDKTDEEKYLFTIKDNGKGMSLDEILNYFLSVGSSFRNSMSWKKEFTSKEGKSLVKRNGKFGIGVLAAFLLGDKITVKTKNYNDQNPLAYTFTADIIGDFINVKKIEIFDAGTEIEILMPPDIFDKLNKKENKEISWTDWYIGDIPTVRYYINGEEKLKQKFFEPCKKREIYPNGYNKIRWDYSKEMRTNWDMFVACNDIIITLSKYSKFMPYSDIVIYEPHLLIEDSQGNLPLNLNRNSLSSQLSFENDLYEDVSKDFIAQLLMAQISMGTIKKYSIHPHDTEFLYSANGFSLVSNYFINKIQDKILLRILTRDENTINNASLILNQSDNLILFPLFNQLYYLRGQKEKVAPYVNAHILLLKQRYEDYFENELRIPQWLINKHKKQWENNKFIAYTMCGFKSQISLFSEDKFSRIMNQIDNNIQSIQEVPINSLPAKKGGSILNSLFEKYFGDNIIIPYDIEERKKLYPLAFEELKDYLKDYEKIK